MERLGEPSAVLGIGTDILEVGRIAAVIERSGARLGLRILTTNELTRIDPLDKRALAKAFAAKEAVAKALGTGFRGGVSWRDIELNRDHWGRPVVSLTGAAARRLKVMGGAEVLLSLSDERHTVLAFAMVPARLSQKSPSSEC